MMVSGVDGGVDKVFKEEEKVDKQYDMGYVMVKLMLFMYIGCLIYKRIFEVYLKMGDGGIKVQE